MTILEYFIRGLACIPIMIIGWFIINTIRKPKKNVIGKIMIYKNEDGDDYMFLELNRDVNSIKTLDQVTLYIDDRT